MTDDSGQFPKLRPRNGGLWLPAGLLVAVIGAAIAWGTNAARLNTVEKEQTESRVERSRMEEHINADDREIAVLKDHLLTIIEQLRDVNFKLDRAETERHR